MTGRRLSRRSLLKLAGAGAATAALPTLAGCSSSSSGGSQVGSAGAEIVPWPTYTPFNGPKPDLPGDPAKGVRPAYLTYPQEIAPSVTDTPGDGSVVRAICITYGAPPTAAAQNAWWTALNEALGVDLQLTIVPSSQYQEKMATVMAGSDLPDLIMFGGGYVLAREAQFVASQGADLSEYLSGDAVGEYPNLANIPTYAWEGMGRINGRIYGVPIERPLPGHPLHANRTLLDQVGADDSAWTADDFTEVLRQLKAAQVWGLSTSSDAAFSLTCHAGMWGAPNLWKVEGGAFVSTYTTEEYRAALEYLREVYAEQLFYPDSVATSQADLRTVFYNGTVAIMPEGYMAHEANAREAGDRFAVDIAKPYAGASTPAPWAESGIFGYTVLKQADPERIRMLLRVLDYLAAPFGTKEYELVHFGLEGEHYTRSDGGIAPTELADAERGPWQYVADAPRVGFLAGHPEVTERVHAYEEAVAPLVVRDPANGLRSEAHSRSGATLSQRIEDTTVAVVTGRQPMSAWDDTVAQWKSGGGDQMAEEYAKEYEALKSS